MNRVYSNGLSGDFVRNPFYRLMSGSSRLHLAAPYFTMAEPLLDAVRDGKAVQLLVGLNSTTSPQALAKVHQVPNLAVRYLTNRFHAKIFIFDKAALLGSANLTDAGFISNREAVICLDQPEDLEAIEEVRALFHELWKSARVLTSEKLAAFSKGHAAVRRAGFDPDAAIEEAVGRAEPPNINVASRERSAERIFLEDLRRQVYEQYRPAFNEVTDLLEQHGFRRFELEGIGAANETNRFLNWVRRAYAVGEEWHSAPLRSIAERRIEILRLGAQWATTDASYVEDTYLTSLRIVRDAFRTAETIAAASRDELMDGLLSLHAFYEQYRFVEGGADCLPAEFWTANKQDVGKVKATLTHLLYGPGDFIERLHDVLYDPQLKLARFARFSALELYGTIKPAECPPMNGRMAKALRYLGFDVVGA